MENIERLVENLQNLTPEDFEDLCVDLLQEDGYNIIRKSGRGPDRGMDILVSKTVDFGFNNSRVIIWLVQCKHKSNNEAVKPNDIGDIVSDVLKFEAEGYLLVTNSLLSTSTEDKISAINSSKNLQIKASYWNKRILINKLLENRKTIFKYWSIESEIDINSSKQIENNPFRELVAFSIQDSNLFFGRDKEITDLLERTYRYPNSVLFGESGAGKTSLLNAGIIPKLINENCTIINIRCGELPIDNIKFELIEGLKKNGYKYVEHLLAITKFSSFIKELKHILNKFDWKIIIIVDQFEEMFTRSTEMQQSLFIEALKENESTRLEKGFLSFLLSLREDYLGKLWELSNKFGYDELWINTYRIDKLSENSASEVVEKTLTAADFSIEEDVKQKLIEDLKNLGNGTIYPPHLQIICYNIVQFANRENTKVINFDLINKLGSAQEILINFVDQDLFKGFSHTQKYIAESILDSLTGNGGLRSFLSLEELVREVGEKEENIKEIIEQLIKKRIIHPIAKNNELIGYELVHDFLSKRFFERLDIYKKKTKIVIETFRNTMRDWSKEGMLASMDRLELFYEFRIELNLKFEEYKMILQSSLNSGKYCYWLDELQENEQKETLYWIIKVGIHERARTQALRVLISRFSEYNLYELCIQILKDHNLQIKIKAAKFLGSYGDKDAIPYLKEIKFSSYHELNRAVYNAIEKLESS